MSRKFAGIVVMIMLALAPAAAMAERPCPSGFGPTISVMGTAQLSFPADQAVLYIGVISQASKASEAARDNAKLSAEVLAALKKVIKQDADKLESAGYDLSPVREYDRVKSVSILKGYKASHTLRYVTADLEDVGAVIDAAVNAGATEIRGPNWQLADPAAAGIKAQQAALNDAKAQASALAATAGMKLGPLMRANSSPREGGVAPMRMAAAKADSSGTSLESGSVTVDAKVLCTYSLMPKK